MLLWLAVSLLGKSEEIQPASYCGSCHKAIYEEWSKSLHAYALIDPIFQMFYHRLDEEGKNFCTNCHSPLSHITVEPSLKPKLVQEGVTCDFCHTAVSGEVGTGKFVLDPKGPKRGPIKDASDRFHPVAFSEFHKKSEFCGVCHQAVNPHGIAVLNTYEEWKMSTYAGRGITCQNCHMPEQLEKTPVEVDEYRSPLTYTSHSFTGGHSQIRLGRAARLSVLAAIKRENITASVFLTNQESGHWLPTGVPSRYILLTISLINGDGKVIDTQIMRFQRIFADVHGIPISGGDVPKMFLEAAGVLQDNRIRPQETRRLEFIFPIPKAGRRDIFTIEAVLTYHLPLPYMSPPEISVEMVRERFYIREKSLIKRLWFFLPFIFAGASFVLLFIASKQKEVKFGGRGSNH